MEIKSKYGFSLKPTDKEGLKVAAEIKEYCDITGISFSRIMRQALFSWKFNNEVKLNDIIGTKK